MDRGLFYWPNLSEETWLFSKEEEDDDMIFPQAEQGK
jgi:hypothetical protein